MRIQFMICLLAFFVGCQSPSGSEVATYDYGDELELKIGEKAIIGAENKTVEFVDVLEDSRCPKNVICVWAGNGKVQIRFITHELQLNTYLAPQDTTIFESRVELISLDPYPEHPRQFGKKDYKVGLLITKQ